MKSIFIYPFALCSGSIGVFAFASYSFLAISSLRITLFSATISSCYPDCYFWHGSVFFFVFLHPLIRLTHVTYGHDIPNLKTDHVARIVIQFEVEMSLYRPSCEPAQD